MQSDIHNQAKQIAADMGAAYLLGEQGKAIEYFPRVEYIVDAWKMGFEVFKKTNGAL